MSDYIVHKAVELDNLSVKARNAITETQWIVSPKYDGCHVVFLFDSGKHIQTLSRSGEVVRSMDHVGRSLLDLYPISSGRIAICGEAWMVGEEFNVISGTFRRHEPQPQLQFVPFDIVPFDYNTDSAAGPTVLLGQFDHRPYPAPYAKRLEALTQQRCKDTPSQVLLPRWYFVRGTLDEAMQGATAYAKEHKARTDSFFDGAVLAQYSGKYNVGSGKGGEFIKCKPLLSYTVTVTGAALDFGTKTGKHTAALKFMLDGMEQKVSTGLTQAQVEEITAVGWDGYRIEVEAMGKTVNGFLREPRFKGIRTDA